MVENISDAIPNNNCLGDENGEHFYNHVLVGSVFFFRKTIDSILKRVDFFLF